MPDPKDGHPPNPGLLAPRAAGSFRKPTASTVVDNVLVCAEKILTPASGLNL